MEYKVVYTKPFNGLLRKLEQQGNKKIVQAVRAAMTEAGTAGEIKSLPRTKNGESRIVDAEKFDLPDAFRLVVQLIDGSKKTRAFLYIGTHDETERWLDNHKNYKWVKSQNDGTLNFIPVSTEYNRHIPSDRLDLDSPEETLELPLLRILTEEQWKGTHASKEQIEFSKTVTGEKYEQDADGILDTLDSLGEFSTASVIIDLLHLAHKKEWNELHHRATLGTLIPEKISIASEMSSEANRESLITFDDEGMLDEIFEKGTFSDWMLFLHPEQEKVAFKDYKGATRLRGVSGSGKTCVIVHRARYLAKKYKQPVLLVTLTESMRKLLEKLADDLCGVERQLIHAKTMSMLSKDILSTSKPKALNNIDYEKSEKLIEEIASATKSHVLFQKTNLASMSKQSLVDFLRDEISYLRGRLHHDSMEKYLDTSIFNRVGRVIPLNRTAREVILHAANLYNQNLDDLGLTDHEAITSLALKAINTPANKVGTFRCILSDEVQDLSELDLTLLGNLYTPDGSRTAETENGLFLAGDGAQSIYKRGFALKRAGIDVLGRSFGLQKSYRNTYEILKAAFNLISQYEHADIDEENLSRPLSPHYAKRHGPKPLIIRCSSFQEEAEAVSRKISSLLAMGQTGGQICVIAPSKILRDEIKSALDRKTILNAELRLDINFESDYVKISTIESAKGHEFANVFIMGLVNGVLPNGSSENQDLTREASRLYVAMTRARESLTITYSPTQTHEASQFLLPIQNECEEAHYKNGELKFI